ncbi:MAG: hypothetical protein AAF696_19145 [Bacteroidota bacterium]
MRHLAIYLCILYFFQDSLFAQKDFSSWDQVEWSIFQKDYTRANAQLEELLAQDKKGQALAQYWRAMVLLESGQTEKAKQAFEKTLRDKEKNPLAWVGLGHYYAQKGDYSFSQTQLNKAIRYGKAKDLELELAIMRVQLEGKQKSNATARAILTNIAEKRPKDISPRLLLFEYYQKLGFVEPAEEVGLELIPLIPEKEIIYVALAELYLNKWNGVYQHLNREGALKSAYRYIQLAFAENTRYADAFRVRAELYLRSNFPAKFQKARDDMASYLSIRQHDQEAQVRYAKFLFLAEEYRESLQLIGELQTKGVEDIVLQRLKGIALRKIEKWKEAKLTMDTYFRQVKPKHRISQDYETYGDILRKLQSPQAAQKYYELAIELKEDRISLYGEIADEYNEEAKTIAAKRVHIRKEGKRIQKELSILIADHNTLAESEKPSKQSLREAEELKDEIHLHQDQLEILYKDSQDLDEEILLVYEKEAYYREKALTQEDNLSLRNQRKYADALFNSRKYESAERAYSRIHEMNEDYLYPYEKRLQIALRLAKTDGQDGPGMERAVPVSEDIIRIFLPKLVG